jgi:hypothetical protein
LIAIRVSPSLLANIRKMPSEKNTLSALIHQILEQGVKA